ncbi:hypothetical protein SDC9_154299 [bioreactor metagenome]|uniref:Uncharacterized protein n=1 Tax=bioreactor metagenome TaxID=1076179 RepID=A0A645EZX3_9ZZZZ
MNETLFFAFFQHITLVGEIKKAENWLVLRTMFINEKTLPSNRNLEHLYKRNLLSKQIRSHSFDTVLYIVSTKYRKNVK